MSTVKSAADMRHVEARSATSRASFSARRDGIRRRRAGARDSIRACMAPIVTGTAAGSAMSRKSSSIQRMAQKGLRRWWEQIQVELPWCRRMLLQKGDRGKGQPNRAMPAAVAASAATRAKFSSRPEHNSE